MVCASNKTQTNEGVSMLTSRIAELLVVDRQREIERAASRRRHSLVSRRSSAVEMAEQLRQAQPEPAGREQTAA
jgi:hypothetical protein